MHFNFQAPKNQLNRTLCHIPQYPFEYVKIHNGKFATQMTSNLKKSSILEEKVVTCRTVEMQVKPTSTLTTQQTHILNPSPKQLSSQPYKNWKKPIVHLTTHKSEHIKNFYRNTMNNCIELD